MGGISLTLLVLKTSKIERLRAFYQALGLQFEEERHGSGPLHYAAKIGDTVFEIYPAAGAGVDAKDMRVGFRVASVVQAVESLRGIGVVIIGEPTSSDWGKRIVVRDPDGRTVEIYAQQ
jgi:catechol 2,3-dioxygenase-like lactoylglutathione lyase family enzyme